MNRRLGFIVLSIAVIGMLALSSPGWARGTAEGPREGASDGLARQAEGLPPGTYRAGRVIVKVKPEEAGRLRVSTSRFGERSLDRKAVAWGARRISRVFGDVDIDEASRRNPSGGERASGAEVPDLSSVFLVEVPEDVPVTEACAVFESDPLVEYAEPDYVGTLHTTPDDPHFSSSGSWNQGYDDQWNLKQIDCEAGWDVEKGDPGVVVAVVDTGIDYTHPDLAASVWDNPGEVSGNGKDDDGNGYVDDIHGVNVLDDSKKIMDYEGHGTHVAGIIGAVTNNGKGVAGVCWNVKIMGVKAFDGLNNSQIDSAEGIYYAANNGADVINMSFGYIDYGKCLRDAVNYAAGNGCVLVAAAGNDGYGTGLGYMDVTFPNGFNQVISVGATDQNDSISNFSSHHTGLTVSAPGGGDMSNALDTDGASTVLSTRSKHDGHDEFAVGANDRYLRLGGTSMAAPHVAGLAALLKSEHPEWSGKHLRANIIGGADDKNLPGWDQYHGHGRINVKKTLELPPCPVAVITKPEMGQFVDDEPFKVWGSASAIGFTHYELGYYTGDHPTGYFSTAGVTMTHDGKYPCQDMSLGEIDLSGMPPGKYCIALKVHTSAGTTSFHTVVDRREISHGEGLPMKVGYTMQNSTPCMADVDQNGSLDLVITPNTYMQLEIEGFGFPLAVDIPSHGAVDVIRPDGSSLPGWPRMFESHGGFHDYFRAQALAEDIDKDGDVEVIVASGHTLAVFGPGGEMEWKKTINYADGQTPQYTSLAVADVAGDYRKEVVAKYDNHNYFGFGDKEPQDAYDPKFGSPEDLFENPEGSVEEVEESVIIVYDCNGKKLPNWPRELPGGHMYTDTHLQRAFPGIACGDLTGDGKAEIVACSFNKAVHVFTGQGFAQTKWPAYVDGSLENETPAIGDINNDGLLEVVVSCRTGMASKVYAFNAIGMTLPGWPRDDLGKYPVLVDLDGDGDQEIVTSGTGKETVTLAGGDEKEGVPIDGLYVTGHEGETVKFKGLPNAESKLAVGDIDSDGLHELAYGTDKQLLAVNLDDGSTVPGFPKAVIDYNWAQVYQVRNPLIGDWDGDGEPEIVHLADNGHLFRWGTGGECKVRWREWFAEGNSVANRHEYLYEPIYDLEVTPKYFNDNYIKLSLEAKGLWMEAAPYGPLVSVDFQGGGGWYAGPMSDQGNHKEFNKQIAIGWNVPEGKHSFRVTGRNANGVKAEATVEFVKDQTPPELDIISPQPGQAFGSIVDVLLDYKDGLSGFDGHPDLFLDGCEVEELSWHSKTHATLYVPPYLPGGVNHTLTVRATDRAGNVTEHSVEFKAY